MDKGTQKLAHFGVKMVNTTIFQFYEFRRVFLLPVYG
jgi:hypothetical protein